jgi:hypothetical protein
VRACACACMCVCILVRVCARACVPTPRFSKQPHMQIRPGTSPGQPSSEAAACHVRARTRICTKQIHEDTDTHTHTYTHTHIHTHTPTHTHTRTHTHTHTHTQSTTPAASANAVSLQTPHLPQLVRGGGWAALLMFRLLQGDGPPSGKSSPAEKLFCRGDGGSGACTWILGVDSGSVCLHVCVPCIQLVCVCMYVYRVYNWCVYACTCTIHNVPDDMLLLSLPLLSRLPPAAPPLPLPLPLPFLCNSKATDPFPFLTPSLGVSPVTCDV